MKSKKLIGAIAAIVMSASFAAGLAACATNSGHKHSWQWKDIGGGEHRQECSCGETGITAPHTNDDGDTICDDCHASLGTQVTVTNVTLDTTEATLTVGGDTLTLTATVTPAGADSVKWESSDEAVAKVEGGVVTPLKDGTAIITAKAGEKSATCSVTVKAAAITITEEQWEQALNLSGKVSVEQTVTGGGTESRTVAKLDGGKTYVKISEDDFLMEMYIEKAENKNYVYSKGYEYWLKSEVTDEQMAGYGIQENFDSGKDFYPFDKFEKGTENGEYVSKTEYTVEQTDADGDPHTITVKEAKIKFSAEGKAVYAEYVSVEDGVEYTNTMDLTYGETIELPEVLEGEQVTPAEITAALAMTDTNYRMGLVSFGSVAFEYQQSGTDKKLVIGAYFSDNTEKEEIYFAKEGDKFFRYNGKMGHWSKSELDGMTDRIYGSEITALGYLEIDLSAYPADAFIYNAEAKAYVLAGDGTMLIAMFKNKKLALATMVQGFSVTTIEFVYGDAQVTLPTIPAGEQLTDAEWATAKAMDFENVEVYEEGESGTSLTKKVGDTIYFKVTGSGAYEGYAVKEGDKYYAYSVEQGFWRKEEIEKSDYDSLNVALTFAGFNKSDFTWDAASGTYSGTMSGGTTAVIKFVDKKFDTVNTQYGRILVNYGAAKITLPKDGDKYTGHGVIIVGPSKPEGVDISEDEWQQLFEDTEKSQMLSVSKHTGEDSLVQYQFNGERGYIAVTVYGNDEVADYVYVDEDGIVYKLEQVEGQIVKTATEYDSLAEIKAEVLDGAFTDVQFGDIREQYENFGGREGMYNYNISNADFAGVFTFDGKLVEVSYRYGESVRMYHFEHNSIDFTGWYLGYWESHVSESEWNKAFEMDYEEFYFRGNDAYLYPYAISKDGGNYCVEDEYGTKYYSQEGGKYYRFYSVTDETAPNNNRWNKEEIDAEEFAESTRVKFFGTYDYGDFTVVDNGEGTYPYYQNSDGTCQITFTGKKISQIVWGRINLRVEYSGDGISMPQDTLTEEEWTAAIDRAFEADCLIYMMPAYTVYVDKNAGIIYVNGNSEEVDNVLYVLEDGELEMCVRNEDGDGYIPQSTDQTFVGLLDWLKAELIEPEVLNGVNVAESYEHFEHDGLGRYTYTVDEETHSTVSVQLKDGKLWTVNVTYTEEEIGQIIGLNYSIGECGAEDVERRLPYWYVNGLNKDKE